MTLRGALVPVTALIVVALVVFALATDQGTDSDDEAATGAETLDRGAAESLLSAGDVTESEELDDLPAGPTGNSRASITAAEAGRTHPREESATVLDHGDRNTALHAVRFVCDGPTENEENKVVLMASTDASADRIEPLTIAASEAIHDLPDGEYVAALRVRGVNIGPVSRFVVSSTPQTVRLAPVTLLDGRARVVDFDTIEPIAGSKVTMVRADLAASWSAEPAMSMSSDSAGFVEFKGLTAGAWRLEASHAGYDVTDATYELPGTYASVVLGDGKVDLGNIDLAQLQTFRFQLVHHEAWNDPTAFTISHTHRGERTAFDPSGAAALHLGWYDMPLYIKLYYPDGRDSVIYLEGGVPAAEEVHELEVGGGRSLEVDLRMSQGVTEALTGKNVWVNVSYRSSNGDANKLGMHVTGEDTYTFRAVQASDAIVSLEVVDDPRTTVWRSQWIELKPDERTTCSLYVDGPPIGLIVLDGSDEPIVGFTCEVRQLPARTSWIAGGTSDADGRIELARVTDRTCSLSGFIADQSVVAIDIEVDLGIQDGDARLVLSPIEHTYVEVTAGGRPVPGVYVEWIGIHSVAPYVAQETNEVGRTAGVKLVTRSRARIRVDAPKYWMPFESIELRPGRNALTIHEVGFLEIPDGIDLETVASEEFGTSLSQWLETRSVAVVVGEGGKRRVRVPVGAYRIRIGEPEEGHVVVTPGRVTRVPR